MRRLIAPSGGEQQKLDVVAEGSLHALGSAPHRAYLVVGQNAGTDVLARLPSPHALYNRAPEVFVPDRVPVHDAADDDQSRIGRGCTVVILDAVEQPNDV